MAIGAVGGVGIVGNYALRQPNFINYAPSSALSNARTNFRRDPGVIAT